MNDSLFELEQLTEEEVRGYDIYRRKHMALYPPPEKPKPSRQGWQFWAYFLVSVAAVLLASMRTAEQFYRAATFSANPVLGYIEAFLAVFTVETGIVVYAAVIAVRRRKISTWVMWVGIVLLASISIVAGLGQSLYLSSDVDPNILKITEYMLSILIGPGASIAALIGGHILGQQISMAAQEYEAQNAEYELEMEQYNDRVIRAWQRSNERKIVLGIAPVSKPMVHEAEAEPRTEQAPYSLAELRAAQAAQAAAQAQSAAQTSARVPAAGTDGGNHRQAQPRPQAEAPVARPVIQPAPVQSQPVQPAPVRNVRPAEAAPMAVPAGTNNPAPFDARYTRQVTTWLMGKGKTPFDTEIDLGAISRDTNIDAETVRNILMSMRQRRAR